MAGAICGLPSGEPKSECRGRAPHALRSREHAAIQPSSGVQLHAFEAAATGATPAFTFSGRRPATPQIAPAIADAVQKHPRASIPGRTTGRI